MTSQTKRVQTPEIVLRVPGPWPSAQDLARHLPDGYEIDDQALDMPDGRRLYFEARKPDRQFPQIFRTACRRKATPRELAGIDRYAMVAAVAGPAGSLAAAQQMLEAGAALLQAGGFGVFVDNSVTAHGGSDWLELAEHRRDANAVFYAYINLARKQSDKQLVSYGMHAFGQRDAVIAYRRDVERSLNSLEDYLRAACAGRREFGEGELFSDERGASFRLQGEPDALSHAQHPMYNPYGRWRLAPAP